MSRKRKKQRANQAVPEEVLAEGSGPYPNAESLANAANEALAKTPPTDVVFEAGEQGAMAEDETESADAPLEDSEVGPELEEAEVAAERAAQQDEQVLEDAVMRAEAEAELGTAEPEGEPGEGEGGAGDDELGAALPTTAATMDDLQLKHLVEALIFAADKPVTMQRLRQLTRISDVKRLEAALATLAQDFADRGISLQQVSGGYQFRTNTQFSTWVQQLIAGRPVRLSRAQLETLAIVAYRQPITRPEVDEIRGVDSSATLRLLMDRSLIRILGKKEDVGRPLLYGTTKEFLDFFSLGDLRELPTLREYSELSAESRKVMSDQLGDAESGEAGEGEDGEAVTEGMHVATAPEPSVEDLVRDFAQAYLEPDDRSTSSSDSEERADEPAEASAQSDVQQGAEQLVEANEQSDVDAFDDGASTDDTVAEVAKATAAAIADDTGDEVDPDALADSTLMSDEAAEALDSTDEPPAD